MDQSVQSNGVSTGGVTGRGWVKGQSGNPGGRPRGLAAATREVLEQAVAEGEDPAYALARFWSSVVEDPKAKMEHRLQAADRLADRGWGKAPQYAPIEEADPLEFVLPDEEVDELAAQLAVLRARRRD